MLHVDDVVVCMRRTNVRDRCFFFFNDTATTEIYTLSLHDALPIWESALSARPLMSLNANARRPLMRISVFSCPRANRFTKAEDRKSTRLNSSHANISYAVFCLKKKKKKQTC